jgi:hypothetical protein
MLSMKRKNEEILDAFISYWEKEEKKIPCGSLISFNENEIKTLLSYKLEAGIIPRNYISGKTMFAAKFFANSLLDLQNFNLNTKENIFWSFSIICLDATSNQPCPRGIINSQTKYLHAQMTKPGFMRIKKGYQLL